MAAHRKSPNNRDLLTDLQKGCYGIWDAHEGRGMESYASRPIEFCRDILGFTPWRRQVDILNAIEASNRVVVRSGRAVGKSTICAAAALWYWATHPKSRVILIASSAKNVQEVLWHECKRLYHGAKKPLGGKMAKLAATGLYHDDGRQIIGVAADKPEALAGIRAPDMMVFIDEASGVSDDINITVIGNLAGGGRLVLIGNPTHVQGFFHDAFDDDAYTKLHVSSLESPNIVEGRRVIPGIADLEWLEGRKKDWGEGSPTYQVHVLGDFAMGEEAALFPLHAIAASEGRWESIEASGNAVIGLDPAGEGGLGDESAFSVRRGNKIVQSYCRRGLSADAHLAEVLGLISTHQPKGEQEPPVLVLDVGGPVGAKVRGACLTYLHMHEGAFWLHEVRLGDRAMREPHTYHSIRDEMFGRAAEWMREGGAIIADTKLERELNALQYIERISGLYKVIDKDKLRKLLNRSPDRADAFMLSCWQSSAWHRTAAAVMRTEAPQPDVYEAPIAPRDGFIDPYYSNIDPYQR